MFKQQQLIYQKLPQIVETLLLFVFISGILFYTNNSFVEQHVLPKVYIFVFFGLLFGAFLFFRSSESVQLDRLTVSVLVFTGYILIATIITSGRSLHILALVGFLLLFFYFKGSAVENRHLHLIIVSLCLLQAIYGLLQYFQVVRIASVFPILGSFDNPAGFAACLAVAFPLSFSLLRFSKYYKWFAIVAMVVMGVAVILSESRAGMVSIGVVSAVYFYSVYWRWRVKPAMTIPVYIVLVLFGGYMLAKDISFEYRWNKIAQASLLGKTKEMLPEYERLHRVWNGNHLFLYNYGAELNHIGEHERSNAILRQCLNYFNDYHVQMILADNYFQLEMWHEAKQHYRRAANMCPNRFIPLFQLHQIALRQNDDDEAKRIATAILEMPIKVPSMTVSRIRFEMQQYLRETEVRNGE